MSRIKKEVRERVFKKYKGHCAYCGKVLNSIKDMQIDHLVPIRAAEEGKADWREVENENNYMPACRRCNHYKRAHDLETFRTMIQEIPKKLYRDSYIFKVGRDFGNVVTFERPITFYFELIKRLMEGKDI